MSLWVHKSGGHEGQQACDTALSSSAGTPREEQQCLPLQLLEDTTILKKIEIHEATITFKECAAVAAGHAPLTDAQSSHGPSTPAAVNSVTNDLLQLLVDEISSMRRTLEAMSQVVQRSNKLLTLLRISESTWNSYNHHYYYSAGVKKEAEKVEAIVNEI